MRSNEVFRPDEFDARHQSIACPSVARKSCRQFALAMAVLAVAMALLAGWAPLGVSIVTVLLFAGPHNWMEARYFLTRMLCPAGDRCEATSSRESSAL